MTDKWALFFPAGAFFVCYCVTALRDYHMFQLNSYKTRAHLVWLLGNFTREYVPRRLFVLPLLPAAFFPSRAFILLSAVLFAIQACFNWPRKAKKPLAYTHRVKRMLATHAVLVASVAVGPCFLGYAGPNFDSIPFLALLLALTPFFTLLSNLLNLPMENAINHWYISDSRRLLREMPNLIVIGVTGSYGKTSVKFFLRKLLSAKFNVLATPESFNTTLGAVKTIRTQLRAVHEVFICEMGARNAGDIKEICEIVRPRHGVITAIGPHHLESFRTIENVIKTKFELADALPPEGLLFLNHDSAHVRNNAQYKRGGRVITCGTSSDAKECDYMAREILVSSQGSSFRAALSDGEERRFETKLLGRHNAQNLLMAVAVADRLGVPPDAIIAAVRRIEAVPHRLQLVRGNNTIIIDDAYNSNARGAEAALETLGMFEGFKILATPGMVELGASQGEYNRRFGQQAASVCDCVILIGERQTRCILEGLKSAAYPDEKIRVAENLERALEAVEKIDSGGALKVLLLENDLPDNY